MELLSDLYLCSYMDQFDHIFSYIIELDSSSNLT